MSSIFRKVVSLVGMLLVAVAIPVLFVRCTPQWTSDSMGFVYVSGSRDIVWFDYESGQTTHLAKAPALYATSGVWPTGDRVVVGTFETGKATVFKLKVYDLKGKLVHESPTHEIRVNEGENVGFFLPVTYVSNDGRYSATFMPTLKRCSVYDFEEKTFHDLEDVMPMVSVAAKGYVQFANSPFPKEGRGMLLFKASDDLSDLEFLYYRFGDQDPVLMRMSDQVREQIRTIDPDQQQGVWTQWRWNQGLMESDFGDGSIQFDPRMQTVHWTSSDESESLFEHAEETHAMIMGRMADGVFLQTSGDELQLWDSKSTEPPIRIHTREKDQFSTLSISPDGKKLVLRAINSGSLEVFNHRGTMLLKKEDPIKMTR